MCETECDLQEARVPQNQICSHDCQCISPGISGRQVFHARVSEELGESALDNEPLLRGGTLSCKMNLCAPNFDLISMTKCALSNHEPGQESIENV